MTGLFRYPRHWRVALAGTAVALACRNPEPTPKETVTRPQAPAREAPASVPVKGAERSLREQTLFVQPLEAGGRLEIRLLAMTSDSTTIYAPADEVFLEVRTGDVVAVRQGKRLALGPGHAWTLRPGERIGLWAAGQSATVRAIYLVRAAQDKR